MKAFDVKNSKGRRDKYDEDLLVHYLDLFMADHIKISQSKANRRLAYKTQVLCFPENPHIRSRSVHTNEVRSLSIVISELLNLNTHLCQAIAEGHDIGHTPYGHIGEKVLSELRGKTFRHEIFGVIVAQEIERKTHGLNLTYETLEGILLHSRGNSELEINHDKPQEYSVVMYADKIAYTFSDLNDAIRYGYLKEESKFVNELGENQRQRNNSCIKALIKESKEKDHVCFSEGKEFQIFNELKNFMFEKVYSGIDWILHETILKKTYDFFSTEFKNVDPIIAISLLTDREANKLGDFFLATRKPNLDDIKNFGVLEILPYLKNKNIDYSNANLEWGN